MLLPVRLLIVSLVLGWINAPEAALLRSSMKSTSKSSATPSVKSPANASANSSPSETVSSTPEPVVASRPGSSKSAENAATETFRPAEEPSAAEATKENEELILEREPDGRYRVIGRKPRKPE